jgi:hypothetical protein
MFLRAAVSAIGLGILAICIFALPIGIREEQAGGYRLILAGLYAPALPFFFALFQAFKLLNLIDKNKAFSELSLLALQRIKYCGVLIGLLFTAGMPHIYQVAHEDDAPGVIALGLVIIGASFTVATFAALLQKLFQNALDMKREQDLTV